jgi:hypothetical protein
MDKQNQDAPKTTTQVAIATPASSTSDRFSSFLSKGIIQNILLTLMFGLIIWLVTKRNAHVSKIDELNKRVDELTKRLDELSEEHAETNERHEMVLKKIMNLIGGGSKKVDLQTQSQQPQSIQTEAPTRAPVRQPTQQQAKREEPQQFDMSSLLTTIMAPMVVQQSFQQPSSDIGKIQELDSELSEELVDLQKQ